MAIGITDSTTLVATLNRLNLETLDAKKRQLSQDEASREQRAQGDRASQKLAEQLRDQSTRDVSKKDSDAVQANQAVARTTQTKQDASRALVTQDGAKAQTLASLVPAKANLSPSDELATFADTSGNQSQSNIHSDAQSALLLSSTVQSGEAVDEDGSHVAVDIITPHTDTVSEQTPSQIYSLTTRAQAATAALYARNSDAVFNAVPIVDLIAA